MSDPNAARKSWLSLLAQADSAALAAHWEALGLAPAHELLRAPEIGGVMVRGRAGAVGAAFNMGEMTVTRASVQLASGEVGHGYVQGRSREAALIAAQVDALMQTGEAPRIEAGLLAPLRAARAGKQDARAAKAAATKVDFFTMVRGED